jgi:hypothetical protein
MREAMDRAAAAQASGAAGAGGRGVNAGAAYRQASNNTAAVTAQGARDTATLRAQEQYNAAQQLAQTVAQMRAADEQISQFNAQQTNVTSLANLNAKLSSMGINTDAELKSVLAAMQAHGPGFGTQLMAAGASSVGPALQYHQGQQQADQQRAMQQQYMDYLNRQQQQGQQQQAMRQQVQSWGPSTPNSGWYYNTPQSQGAPYDYMTQFTGLGAYQGS